MTHIAFSFTRLRMMALWPVILMLAGLAGCGQKDPQPPLSRNATEVRHVRSALIQSSLEPVYHVAPATLVAEKQVQVSSRLMGYIHDIHVAEGESVRVGQRLFSVDPVDIQSQLEQSRAALQQAQDTQRDARQEYERFSALLKEEAVSRQQYEKMKLQHELATGRVAQAQAGVNAAANQLRYATVTAPMAGVVTRQIAHAGDLAAPGQPVLVLESQSRLQVETHVPAAIVQTLKSNAAVNVEIDGLAQPVRARIARISPAADPVSRLFHVKLDVAAPGLHSGLFARALFPQGARATLKVPETALVTRAGITGIFVVGRDGVARFRMVRTGAAQAGQVVIQSGLQSGERIVLEHVEPLESGDKIAVPGA